MGSLTLGKTTTRKATDEEMKRHKATVESSIQKGEVTREEVNRSGTKSSTKTKSSTREREPIVLDKRGVETGEGETSSQIAPQEQEQEEDKSLLQSTKEFLKNSTLSGRAEEAGIDLQTGTVPIGFGSGTLMVKQGSNIVGKGINLKSFQLSKGILSKVFSAKTMAILGGAAGTMFLGVWGQAEAGEPLSIVMRDVMQEAERTGDWTLYNEAAEARDEIVNLETWEKIVLWSPASPLIGITNKIKGAIKAAAVQNRLAKDLQIQQETGESEDDKWARIREDEVKAEKDNIDYYNNERKKMVQWEQEANKNQRNEDATFWRKERENQSALETADREATAKFWLEYRKEAQKLSDNNRPSNLNFGLL